MKKPATRSAKFASFALLLSLALVLWFAVAAFGPKFGVIHWQTGLMTMTFTWGLYLIGLTAQIAAIALVWTLLKAPRSGWFKAVIALAIPAVFFALLASTKATGERVPPIYDITTNTANPPAYSEETLALRSSIEANPLIDFQTPLGEMERWQGERFAKVEDQTAAELIAAGYPELNTVLLPVSPDVSAQRVADAMTAAGFTNVRSANGRVEGVAETFLYGFKDDVVARITPVEGGSEVDFRSTSRVGLSDLGANAKRIGKLIEAIEG
ncbi:DUF1499 domain-containing protein [Allopontixanthobacter sp.]|uniref:DUF1499 domain-containing protein n=1 Tax=Allopontixanthobacter sp. TaxID=2906452 RepID=UPI002ABADD18|nr:DUF1499 domain-containing protein [Allopontixanthobacter sp.]MDZ4307903.1 DUF1499 domain-containing protein [Allopontixanthobacter sp.]